jgi:hypothetical protein
MIGDRQTLRGKRPGPVFYDLPTTIAWSSLLLLSLAVCLAFVFSYPIPDVKNDAVEYLALSRSMAAGTGFSQDGGVTPAVYRPPLFSFLLGGWFYLTGTLSVLSAVVFQSVLHALGVAAAFFLFLEVRPSLPWAFGGGLFLAVNLLLVTRVVFVLQETTLLLFTTIAVLASVRLVRAPSPLRAALAGAAWGACTLGKIVSWFAPFLLLAMCFLPVGLRWNWRRKEAAILLLCFVAVIAPWTVRNYLHFQRIIPVNGQGVGMLEWNVEHAEIPGDPPGRRVVEAIKERHPTEGGRRQALGEYVRDHARYFLVDRVIWNVVHYSAPPRDWWLARGHTRPGEHRLDFWILAVVYYVPFYLILLVRTWQWVRRRHPPSFAFLLLLFFAYGAQHALVWGDQRFNLAVYPVLLAIALSPPETGRSLSGDEQEELS